MASVNKAIIVGNLGRDPDAKVSANGTAVTSFSVATTRKYKAQDGTQQQETEWHRCTALGKVAEIAAQYLTKGAPVYIEGRLRTRKYQGKDGQERSVTEIIVESLQLLGSRADRDESRQPTQTRQRDNFDEADVPF